MIRYIGHFFDQYSWIFPETISTHKDSKSIIKDFGNGKDIKNNNLRIRVNSMTGNKYDPVLEVFTPNSKRPYKFNANLRNIIEIIQFSGILDDGTIPGTFRFTENYLLIPDESKEGILKRKITESYQSIPWGKKAIPGHLYLLKARELFLCIGSNLDVYSKCPWPSYMMFRYASVTPRKIKLLCRITPYFLEEIDKHDIDSLSTLARYNRSPHNSGWSTKGIIYSDKYLLKDVGKLFDEENYLETYFDTQSDGEIEQNYLLMNECWKIDKGIRQYLIEKLNCDFYGKSKEACEFLGKLERGTI